MQTKYKAIAVAAAPLILVVVILFAASTNAVADCGFTGGDAARGDKVYHTTCVACHGEDGRGVVPGAPDFTKKGGVLSKPHSSLTLHIKNGFHSPGKPLAMPPKGGNPDLTDQDIKDVHAYLHHRFGCG
jgi:mono/diheme cytochrome c family protein